MNMNDLDFETLPRDAGQTVAVDYAVDWETETLYRCSADRSRPGAGIAMHAARITGGEFEPQNGVLPEHGDWTPADEDTAALEGRGLHYRSSEWQRLAAFVPWQGAWPVIDANGDLTGEVSDGSGENELNVDDEAMIIDEDARAGGWQIDAEEGRAWLPTVAAYEVRMSDRVENTGLDCQRFASREEAQQAADMVNADHPQAKAAVIEVAGKPTITFAAWNAAE
jgi:hypothetical protein